METSFFDRPVLELKFSLSDWFFENESREIFFWASSASGPRRTSNFFLATFFFKDGGSSWEDFPISAHVEVDGPKIG